MAWKQTGEIMRCSQCGEKNSDAAVTCCVCNAPLRTFRRVITSSALPPDQSSPAANPASTSQNIPAAIQPSSAPALQSILTPTNVAISSSVQISANPIPVPSPIRQNQIQGRVISVGQVELQPEGFDWYMLLTHCLWFILLILSLLLAVYAILMKVGVLLACLLAGLCLFVFFWLLCKNPYAFIQTLFVIIQSRLLMTPFRQGQPATQPVRNLRVREKTQQQEIGVWIKGYFSSGDIGIDDEVTIWGRWRNGNFVFRSGINQRTGARICLRPSKSKILFWATLIITVGAICAVYTSVVSLFEHLRH
jgi:membrane protein implicated in regulation of membrane protease activity